MSMTRDSLARTEAHMNAVDVKDVHNVHAKYENADAIHKSLAYDKAEVCQNEVQELSKWDGFFRQRQVLVL